MQSTDDKTHRKPLHAGVVRRRWLGAVGGGLLALAWARSVPARDGPLRVACDPDVQASGVTAALVRAFARDTGLAVTLVPLGAQAALDETEAGRCDTVLSASPELAGALFDQGLLHDRRTVARLRWVLAGPIGPWPEPLPDTETSTNANPGAPPGPPRAAARPARPTGPLSTDVIGSLQSMAADTDARRVFLVPTSDTATRNLADGLWREAGLPASPAWRTAVPDGVPLLEEARRRSAWALIGAWAWATPARPAPGPNAARPPSPALAPWGLVVDHDTRLSRPVLALRSFRSNHPAARLFSEWIAGPAGRRSLSRLPGVLPGASPGTR